MSASSTLLTALMQLPETERFEVAIAVLDQSSPDGLSEDEIVAEARSRQDELESGNVVDIGFAELVTGLHYRPRSLGE